MSDEAKRLVEAYGIECARNPHMNGRNERKAALLGYISRIERERAEFRNDALGCTSRIAALEAENETLRADAERYRWLRKRPVSADFGYSYQANEALDAAIDAARGE